MFSQNNFRINIISIYLFILLAGIWISYSVFQTGNSIQSVSLSLTERHLPSLNNISELKRWIKEYERVLYELYATTNNSSDERESIYKKLHLAEKQIELNSNSLSEFLDQNQDIQVLIQIFEQLQKHAMLLDQALPPEPWDWDDARRELATISKKGRESLPHLDNLTSHIERLITQSKKSSDLQLDNMSLWVSIFSSMILLIAVLVGYYIRKANIQSLEKQRLGLFVEKNPNPVACIDFQGKLVFGNASWSKHYPLEDSKGFIAKLFSQIESMKGQVVDFAQFNLQEDKQFLELSIHKIKVLQQFMVYIEDVTEKEVARQELEFLAYHDELTGLPNLKKLEVDLDKLISTGNQTAFSLVSVGVRRLQLITTTHGHSVSDALIRALVMRIQNCLTDIIAKFEVCRIYRFTGAKFEVLISGKNEKEDYKEMINELSIKLRQASEKSLQTSFGQFFLDLRAGYVSFPEHGYSGSMLIKNSSSALNEAQKNNSKNIVMFDHELSYREQNWYRLENDMRQSSFDRNFFLTYQPKVNLKDSSLVGMEALIRWNHPTKGLISPVEFIPIAEESGMIIALGEWIMENAIKQTSLWLSQGAKDIQIAVNVSPSQLLSNNFIEMVKSKLEKYKLPGRFLEIEITEEVMVDDKTLCIEILETLKNAEISIAMDDFGTGYSSLSYLNKFPLSKLKIDRSFVTDIHIKEGNLAIVKTIIALSKSLNIKVIAEGIEAQEEVNILNELGCEQGQGYYFAKPLESADFEAKFFS